jgi:hypothetical protein
MSPQMISPRSSTTPILSPVPVQPDADVRSRAPDRGNEILQILRLHGVGVMMGKAGTTPRIVLAKDGRVDANLHRGPTMAYGSADTPMLTVSCCWT